MTIGTYRTCFNQLSQALPACPEISSGAACSSPPCNNSSCTIVLYSFAEINLYLFVLSCKFPFQKAINTGNNKYSQNVVFSFAAFLLQSLSKTKINKQTNKSPPKPAKFLFFNKAVEQKLLISMQDFFKIGNYYDDEFSAHLR